MSLQDEGKFKSSMKAIFEHYGAKVVLIHGGDAMQAAGIPDMWVGHELWHGWLELKTEREPLRSLQKLFIKDCWRMKSSAFMFRRTTVDARCCLQVQDFGGAVLRTIHYPVEGYAILGILASCSKMVGLRA